MGTQAEYGFREVLIEQPFSGKWTEVDMNLGGGHNTFQGIKFSDFAGGFSYKPGSSIVQNRFIYWRTINDTLELTELSMDFNLKDNQIRFIFQDSAIVGPVTIQETDHQVVILVATVTSINRLVFAHPCRIQEQLGVDKSMKPSIFQTFSNKSQPNFKSFNLYENAFNIPVPLSATCIYIERGRFPEKTYQPAHFGTNGECLFAFAFESGSIHVYKITKDDSLIMHDLKRSSFLGRIFSGFTPSLLRGNSGSQDSVVGLSFFTCKEQQRNEVYLVTLSMKGQLNLWASNDLDSLSEWSCSHCGIVDDQFSRDSHTDTGMFLRKSLDNSCTTNLPLFAVYIPDHGFKLYETRKVIARTTVTNHEPHYTLTLTQNLPFAMGSLLDFSLSSEYLFAVVCSASEEAEWEVYSYSWSASNPSVEGFEKVLLEPLPVPDVSPVGLVEAKQFYMDLIFSKASFSAPTIMKALAMFRREGDEDITEQHWETLKILCMNLVDREISLAESNSEFSIADEDFIELVLKYWLMLYNSCVEYHIHTMKPLGVFYETNTKMTCIVRKNRISFLRPTEFLETLFYYPRWLQVVSYSRSDIKNDENSLIEACLASATLLEAVEVCETVMNDSHVTKINKRLRESLNTVNAACNEIVGAFCSEDVFSEELLQREFLLKIEAIVQALEPGLQSTLSFLIQLIGSWDGESIQGQIVGRNNSENSLSDCHMGSRLGSHMTYKILKQMLEHRYLLTRNLILLQLLVVKQFSHETEKTGNSRRVAEQNTKELFSLLSSFHAIMEIADDYIYPVQAFVKERSLKVANILKLHTFDHLGSEDYTDPMWPTRTIEGFCLSRLGTLNITRMLSGVRRSSIIAYAEATGRCLWPNYIEDRTHPFDEFLIISSQYLTLEKYAQYLVEYFKTGSKMLKNFYLGLTDLFLGDPYGGLNKLNSIDIKCCLSDPYFCSRVLGVRDLEQELPPSVYTSFYIKLISIFQVFELTSAVKTLAKNGIKVAENDDVATKMCSLAFKSALELNDYMSSYEYIICMPGDASRKERLASLRMFIGQLLRHGEIDVLMKIDLQRMYNGTTSVGQLVRQILLANTNLADPFDLTGTYPMVFFYHMCQNEFQTAAGVAYYRVWKIGEKGTELKDLLLQRDSLTEAISALTLVESPENQFVLRRQIEASKSIESDVDTDAEIMSNSDNSLIRRTIEDIVRELELVCMLIKLNDTKPLRIHDLMKRAKNTIDRLITNYRFDDAIKLSKMWGVSITPVIGCLTDVCCNLVHNVMPRNGTPAEYLKYNDISDLPVGDGGILDIGFRLLQSYLKRFEKSADSELHQEATLRLLAANIDLPQWLVISYKKRNSAQLLRCYMRYQEWEKATDLCLNMLDASLGKGRTDVYDMPIQKISSYEPVEPVLPFKDINLLASQLRMNSKNPTYAELYTSLRSATQHFCTRVKESTAERNVMFSERLESKRMI